MTTAQSITLASRPTGSPVPENFALVDRVMPDPGAGEFLVRVIWLSLDPYMRGRMDDAKSYAEPVAIGGVMEGGAVGEVIVSNHAGFDAGDIVTAQFGWTTHAISDGEGVRKVNPDVAPISTALGALGMPGITAWVGLNEIAAAQAGETIVVSAATGAVGGMVGQLAKAKGMRVIGVAGGAEKCAFAEAELGYDICLDHRAMDAKELAAALKAAAPDGVDVYFENVGGKTLEAVLTRMNTGGRIAVCGAISWYSGQGIAEAQPLPAVWRNILTRRLRVQGFIIFDHFHLMGQFQKEVGPLVGNGTIKVKESVTDGLENAPAAFIELLKGGNFGKQLVRVGDDP
ncbi:NADP-dependent oxidoreductase [uncultured Litoreibacter sp.]|uniref:NADP-dependent oxidoreductase n=1 Tax=uncultured Litoreibacter sp. TaxID=1392394 RepID=UPI00260B2D42|nr:NADP-dependent oxidoreductase [uncultured Litoreibacter sp.]